MDTPTLRRDIGARLQIVMEANGDQPKQVALSMGILPSKLNNWTMGRHFPDPLFLVRFCERYRVSLDFIFLGKHTALAAMHSDALRRVVEAAGELGQAVEALQKSAAETV